MSEGNMKASGKLNIARAFAALGGNMQAKDTGIGKSTDPSDTSDLEAEIKQLKTENEQLKEKIEELQSELQRVGMGADY
jgi:cell division protein FtsB